MKRAITKTRHLDWVPYHFNVWGADTLRLNATEQGAYHLLVDFFYSTGTWPPDDDSRLAMIARCTPEQWAAVRPAIASYFQICNREWQHDRAESIARHALRRYRINAQNGALGAAVKNKHANGLSGKASSLAVSIKSKSQKDSLTTNESLVDRSSGRSSVRAKDRAHGDDELFPHAPSQPQESKHGNRNGSRLPKDWEPSEADRQFAAALGLDADKVADAFRDYWHAKAGQGGRKVDWSATWRNWCRTDADKRKGAPRGSVSGPSRSGGLASAFGRLHADLAAKERNRK